MNKSELVFVFFFCRLKSAICFQQLWNILVLVLLWTHFNACCSSATFSNDHFCDIRAAVAPCVTSRRSILSHDVQNVCSHYIKRIFLSKVHSDGREELQCFDATIQFFCLPQILGSSAPFRSRRLVSVFHTESSNNQSNLNVIAAASSARWRSNGLIWSGDSCFREETRPHLARGERLSAGSRRREPSSSSFPGDWRTFVSLLSQGTVVESHPSQSSRVYLFQQGSSVANQTSPSC